MLRLPLAALCPLIAAALPASVLAQDWSAEGEVGASVFFGNTDQVTVTTRAAVERGDSIFEFSADVGFNYGEASNSDGVTLVNKRSWLSNVNIDYRPYGRVSPFFFARVESSLEKRLALRHSSGLGGKVLFIRSDRTRLDLSASLLAERTMPMGEVSREDDRTLARWSARLRFRRTFGDERMTFNSENSYQPVFNTLDDFTFNSKNSLSYALTQVVALRLSFVDSYDSAAISRGARTNNDGQLLFSVISRF
jgi:hypothetical protein